MKRKNNIARSEWRREMWVETIIYERWEMKALLLGLVAV